MSAISDFGLFLKHERELRGIPLEEIANATKIHMRFLTALENNDYAQFPGEVFIKGYIRSYAKSIGTDVESMLSVYEDCVGKRRTESIQKARTDEEISILKKTALRRNIIVSVCVAGFAFAGFYLTEKFNAASMSAKMKTGNISASVNSETLENTASLDMAGAIKPDHTDLPGGDSEQALSQKPTESADGKPETADNLLLSSLPTPPVASETNKKEMPLATQTKKEDKKEAAVPSTAGREPQINADEAKESVAPSKTENAGDKKEPLRLRIKATSDSWFNITVDGSRKMEFILSAGTSKSLSGKESFVVSIGNKEGAELALNGRRLALPDSDDSVIRDFQITPKLLE